MHHVINEGLMFIFFFLCPSVSACMTPFTWLEAAYPIRAAPLAAILNQSKELFLFESFLCYPKSRMSHVSGFFSSSLRSLSFCQFISPLSLATLLPLQERSPFFCQKPAYIRLICFWQRIPLYFFGCLKEALWKIWGTDLR